MVKGKTRAVVIFEIRVPAPIGTGEEQIDMKSAAFILAALLLAASGVARSSAASSSQAAEGERRQEQVRRLEHHGHGRASARRAGEREPDEQVRRLQDKDVTKYVSLLGGVLAQASSRPDLKWKFIVLDTDGVNAFAAPGGLIHMTRGLLGLAKNEAELAGVLGHEITHVTAKHTVRAIQKSKGISMGTDQVGSGLAPERARREDGAKRPTTWFSTANSAAKTRTKPTRLACELANKVGYAPSGLVDSAEEARCAQHRPRGAERPVRIPSRDPGPHREARTAD